jgi:predicted amidophosphoribosyltransferase
MTCYEDYDFQTCPRCGNEGSMTVYLPRVVVSCGAFYDFDTSGEKICEDCIKELALEVEDACLRWERKETKTVEVIK